MSEDMSTLIEVLMIFTTIAVTFIAWRVNTFLNEFGEFKTAVIKLTENVEHFEGELMEIKTQIHDMWEQFNRNK